MDHGQLQDHEVHGEAERRDCDCRDERSGELGIPRDKPDNGDPRDQPVERDRQPEQNCVARLLNGLAPAADGAHERRRVVVHPREIGRYGDTSDRDSRKRQAECPVAHPASAWLSAFTNGATPGLPEPSM